MDRLQRRDLDGAQVHFSVTTAHARVARTGALGAVANALDVPAAALAADIRRKCKGALQV
jgi:hypothetical protein